MATYRVYFLDQGGHISRPAKILEAFDDPQRTGDARYRRARR